MVRKVVSPPRASRPGVEPAARTWKRRSSMDGYLTVLRWCSQEVRMTGDPILISTKTIPPEDRLIFALDVATAEEARRLVSTLKEAVRFYKVGLELFLGAGFALVDWLLEQ